MNDYICKEDAIRVAISFPNPYYKAEYIERCVSRIPSADVVKVVRCKECKHRAEADYINTDTRKSGKYQTCLIHGGEFTPDDYCSYGERENNEINKC